LSEGTKYFSLLHSADIWGQPRLLSGVYPGLFTEVKEAGTCRLPPSGTGITMRRAVLALPC